MNFIKGSLHNLAKENHPDPRYCQGIVLGIVTTLMSDEGGGMMFDQAKAKVMELLPEDYDPYCIPEAWRD